MKVDGSSSISDVNSTKSIVIGVSSAVSILSLSIVTGASLTFVTVIVNVDVFDSNSPSFAVNVHVSVPVGLLYGKSTSGR